MEELQDKVKLGISACLPGEKVRWNAGHKLDRFLIETLGQKEKYMKNILLIMWLWGCLLYAQNGISAGVPVSEATADCLDCHSSVHPGIVKDWQNSRHAKTTPKDAAAVQRLARKVSNTEVHENLQNIAVGCAECHMLRPEAHADTFDHNGYDIHVVVSPDDCRSCHSEEATQYSKNIMAHAYNNLAGNKLYRQQEQSIIGKIRQEEKKPAFEPADEATRADACYYCHGTRLKVTGFEIRNTDAAGELQFPVIAGWPNQGVGRVNPDGSLGSCSACHTRHSFSIEMARKPYTCEECHVGPDVPAFKVYVSSKHGNIFSALHPSWNFNAVPWTIGKDFTAPTCAACHISLLVNTDQEVVSERTHQVSDRLPWRLFGLIYAHPQPQNPDTTIIRNKNDLPLPTDFEGGFAAGFLIGKVEMDARRKTMQAACLNCHDTSWVKGQWERLENTIQETNHKTRIATAIMQEIWSSGFAAGLEQGGNPFDEAIEKKWTETWLLYANTIRFASAMGCGGDYGVFAGGRYQLSTTLLELNAWLQLRKEIFSNRVPQKAQ
jgi:hydroxylamine dehydrogenase